MLRIAIFLVAALVAGPALACPDARGHGAALAFGAAQVARPQHAQVIAGGALDLAACAEVPGAGHVAPTPQFTLELGHVAENRALELRTRGACDTILLVRDPHGRWRYDDDATGGGDALIRLLRPTAGPYDIWIGTYGAVPCIAGLVVATVRGPKISLADAD
jgi:hypothetical protein